MTIHITRKDHATSEDRLRALSYASVGMWAVVFAIWPPAAFVAALDERTRLIWMAITFLGSVLATAGALSRIDIKLEMPGILVLLVGPIFYTASQGYYALIPNVAAGLGNQRYAISVYALVPVLMLLPRLYSLIVESRRLKRINSHVTDSPALTAAEEAQPGAGFHVVRAEVKHKGARR